MSEQIRDPAAAAKKRQRGLTVLERLAEAERIEAQKEEARLTVWTRAWRFLW